METVSPIDNDMAAFERFFAERIEPRLAGWHKENVQKLVIFRETMKRFDDRM